jgi:hypothetical protein
MPEQRAIASANSLYPRHRDVISKFAERTGRTMSNALQRIIDQWAEDHPDQWNGHDVGAGLAPALDAPAQHAPVQTQPEEQPA